MAGHTSEKRWEDTIVNGRSYQGISQIASDLSRSLVQTLTVVNEKYLELQEIYAYAGGTTADLAEQLFKEDIEARPSPDNVASAEEIAKTQDLVDAVTAAYQVYQAANNVAVTQDDRLAKLRRMS